jgi:hypothetical protein
VSDPTALDEIAKGTCHWVSIVATRNLLDVHGLEMKYKWHYFLAACFFASYLLISNGVPLFPVLAGCGFAAVLTWRQFSRQPSPHR